MLFFEMVKILKARQPRFFIAENVKGILSANNGKAFPMIIKEFENAGYKVVHKLLNASEYGVPQKRERVIIVGFHNEEDFVKFKYPQKVHTSERLNSTDPVFMVDGRYRRFSTREAARIQSFPDSFKLDSVSQIRQYKAIGNAVPPVLMWHVIRALQKVIAVHVLDLNEVKVEYPNFIVDNTRSATSLMPQLSMGLDMFDSNKNVLISLVKSDNMEQYLDRSAKVYYTGKKFPSTVALNKLYYFMPYIKRKGVRDLYIIKIARVGTKKEVHPECDDNDFRLVFEIQYIGQLFNDYQPIHLDIWRAFTDTTIEGLFKLTETNKKVCFE